MKPIATITVDEFDCLVIEGKMKISKEARKWIKQRQDKGRHVAAAIAILRPNGKIQTLIFADSTTNRLFRTHGQWLNLLTMPKLRDLMSKESPIDDFPDHKERLTT
ncbi:MAG: hypothetical protein HZC04_00530 [Candidatus Lloydbacteria bacterium]|nr:hypothetical protein [Candidatus Lloydbacteria bacterium]